MGIDAIEVPETNPGYRLTLVYRLLSDIKRRRSLQTADGADEANLPGNQPELSGIKRSSKMGQEDRI